VPTIEADRVRLIVALLLAYEVPTWPPGLRAAISRRFIGASSTAAWPEPDARSSRGVA
jgi:hypothetical protein